MEEMKHMLIKVLKLGTGGGLAPLLVDDVQMTGTSEKSPDAGKRNEYWRNCSSHTE